MFFHLDALNVPSLKEVDDVRYHPFLTRRSGGARSGARGGARHNQC